MFEKRISRIIIIVSCLALGLFPAASAYASLYNFHLDHFELTGNGLGNVSDSFDDNSINTDLWEVYDPTVVESGTTISFQNPGSTDAMQLGNLQISTEMSYIHAKFSLYDGSGSYQGTSAWSPIIPGTNQFYVMNLSSVGSSGEPDENIVIGVANFDSGVSAYFESPAGPMVFFGRSKGTAKSDIDLQGYSIIPADVTGDILLRLAFDDNSNLFSGSFSLDGGSNFLTPFTDVASTGELLPNGELTLGAESWDAQAVPIPSSMLLLLTGLAGIGAKQHMKIR